MTLRRACAGQFIARLLELVTARPVRARAASDNVASMRVLRKAGFETIGTEIGYAAARRGEIEKTILRLE
jgi:RimJ/RimL family protein N-acetyltransferase